MAQSEAAPFAAFAAFPSATKTYHNDTYPAIDPTQPSLSTKGKCVLITGGGSGIGPEIAKAFAQFGVSHIAILGLTEATLNRSKKAVEDDYPGTIVTAYVADMTDAKDMKRVLAQQAKLSGTINILVANAGFLPRPGSAAYSGESIHEKKLGKSSTFAYRCITYSQMWTTSEILDNGRFTGFEINVKGNFNLLQEFVPYASPDAVVLNVTTGIAHLPYIEGLSGYATSKLAGAKLFEYLHVEHPNFMMLNVQPGVIATDMNEKSGAGSKMAHNDVGLPTCFLVWAASPKARFLNGKLVWANWDVDELEVMSVEFKWPEKYTLGLLGWP